MACTPVVKLTKPPAFTVGLRLVLLAVALFVSAGVAAQVPVDPPSQFVRSVPSDGARAVPLDQAISLFFTEPLDVASVHGGGIVLRDGQTVLVAVRSLSHDRRCVTLRCTTPLPASRQVQVLLDGARLLDAGRRAVDVDGDGRDGGQRVLRFHMLEPVQRVLEERTAVVTGYVFDSQDPPQPMPNATVRGYAFPRVEGAAPLPAPVVTTDATGFFRYTTPTFAFELSLLVEIKKAGHSEALRQVTLGAGNCWRVEDAYLQPITVPVPVTRAAGATLVDPLNPGVRLIIPPNALQADSNVGVTLLRNGTFLRDRLPELVGEGDYVDVAGVFGEATLLPVTLEVPNRYNLPLGTRVPFGKVDHNTLAWTDLRDIGASTLGEVKVRPDNSTYIEVQFDKFCSICTGYCLPYPNPNCTDASCGNENGNPDCDGPGRQSGNSVISLREGHLQEFVELPGLIEFGSPFQLALGYASNSAAPSISLSASVDYASTRPIEGTIYRFQMEGATAEALYDRTANNQKPVGTFFWNGRDGLGNLRRTGSYPYVLEAVSLNANAQVAVPTRFGGAGAQFFSATYPGVVRLRSQPVRGRAVLVNQRDSEFGAGWSLLQEPRLHFDGDGCLVLLLGNSDYRVFRPDPAQAGRWSPPAGEGSSFVFNGNTGNYDRLSGTGAIQSFAADGRIVSAVDRYGHRVSYLHSTGRLVRITSPTGYFFALTYDGRGKLTRIQDSAGRTTTFVIDAAGDLTQVTSPAGVVRRFQYDAEHRLVAQRGPRGERSEYDYVNGRVVATRAYDVDGSTLLRERRFAPSALRGEITHALRSGQGLPGNPIALQEGRLDTYIDGTGAVTVNETNTRGQTIATTDALGAVTRFTFSQARELLATIHPDGSRTEYGYDANGNANLIRERSSAVVVHSTVTVENLGPFGQLTKIIDPEGKQSTLQYDALGSILVSADHDDNQTRFFYADPRFPQVMTRVESATGSVVTMTYDVHGNLRTVTDYPDPTGNPAGRTTIYDHAVTGHTTRVIDPRGLFVQFVYDADGRVTSQIDELLRGIDFAYDDAACSCQTADITRVTLPGGGIVRYAYDGLGRIVRRTDQAGKSSATTYDPEGRVLSVTNRNNQVLAYEYDAVGRLVRKTAPMGEVTNYEWDVLGNLAVVTDGRCRLDFTNDFLGQTTRSTALYDIPVGLLRVRAQHRLDFTYDRVGGRLSVVDDLGLTNQVYTYDNQHLPSTLTLPSRGNQRWTYAHDGAGRRTQITPTPAGRGVSFTYDRAEQLTSVDHATLPALSVAYPSIDPIQDLLSVRRTVGGSSFTGTFGYDGTSQLLTAVFSAALGDQQVNRSYAYDGAGRLSADGDYTYTWDDEGNLRTRVRVGTTLTDTFTWDVEGRLRSVRQTIDPGTGPVQTMLATYVYDPLGRRVLRDVNGVVRQYLWDGMRLLYTLDGSGRVERAYTHGVGRDEPLAVFDPVTNTTHYYVLDGQGSVVGLSDSAGSLLTQYHYEEFGATVSATTPHARQAFGYTGREFDPETGLQRHMRRLYDQRTGRFVSEDPLEWVADPNFYRYVGNSPIRGVDPLGLDWTDWIVNRHTANFFAGVGDALTFGLTDVVRDKIGGNEVVDKCSGVYKAGVVGGSALGLATGGVGSLSGGIRGTTNAIFYSGGRGALQAARNLAASNGGRLLEGTLGGRALNGLDRFLQARGARGLPTRVWDVASSIFARNARGPVSAVLRGAPNPASTWLRIEKPILERAGNLIRLF